MSKASFLTALIAVLLSSVIGEAHPYHVTLAEMEYNAESKKLEVALQLKPEDLERALSKELERPIVLEKEKAVESLIKKYLAKRFLVMDSKGAKLPLQWVGYELKVKVMWLYFEIPSKEMAAALSFENSLFFELEARQANTINYRAAKSIMSLTCTHKAPKQRLRKKTIKKKKKKE